MAFTRWDPLADLLTLQQRLDRFAAGPARWMPPVDLFETREGYTITAEVPGLQRSDLEIQLEGARLSVSGARRDRDASCEQYHRIERGHGTFTRVFELPLAVDGSHITADLRDGVLTVTCPKLSDTSARRVDIG